MMRLPRIGLAIVVFGALLCAAAGHVAAIPTYYTDRASFNAAAGGGLSFESFEVAPPGWAPSYDFDGFTMRETNGTNALTNTLINSYFTACVTHGEGAVWYDDNGDSIGWFEFDPQVTAFGVDVTASGTCTVAIGGDVSSSLALTANTPAFFGVIDGAGFDTISFSASGGPNVGFDAVAFLPVPEPSSIALCSIALGMTIAAARRRRRRA
jgi:hypothetical protein